MLHDVGENPRVPGERLRPARFSSFLRSFVVKSVLAHRDKQAVRTRREPTRLETPVAVSEDGSVLSWADVFSPVNEIPTDVEFWDWIRSARDYLLTRPQKGKRDLVRCFEAIVRQVVANGVVNRREIVDEFGCSDTAVFLMFKDLREELTSAGLAMPTALGHAAA
jgi:hypothetical protein